MKLKLSLKIILEDLDVQNMNPKNIGLYSFIQAMNKNANESPVPMPVIDIISDSSIKINPGPFSYSRNSFKIKINPQAERIDFSEAGHDFFHALTTNLAKHFARLRPEEDGRGSFDLERKEVNKSSKFNRNKNFFNKNELEKIKPIAQKYGITDLSIQNLFNLEDQLEIKIGTETSHLGQRFHDHPEYGKYRFINFLLTNLNKSNHFKTSRNVKEREFEQGRFDVEADRNLGAAQKYGLKYYDDNHLPQYDLEELFGNLVAGMFEDPIKNSSPMKENFNIARLRDNFGYNDRLNFGEKNIEDFIVKFKDFLQKVQTDYNVFLKKYQKTNFISRSQEKFHWNKFSKKTKEDVIFQSILDDINNGKLQ